MRRTLIKKEKPPKTKEALVIVFRPIASNDGGFDSVQMTIIEQTAEFYINDPGFPFVRSALHPAIARDSFYIRGSNKYSDMMPVTTVVSNIDDFLQKAINTFTLFAKRRKMKIITTHLFGNTSIEIS